MKQIRFKEKGWRYHNGFMRGPQYEIGPYVNGDYQLQGASTVSSGEIGMPDCRRCPMQKPLVFQSLRYKVRAQVHQRVITPLRGFAGVAWR